MMNSLTTTRSQIREEISKEMKSWLFEARHASGTIGKLALESMNSRNKRWKVRKQRDLNGSLRLAKVNGPVELAVSERHESKFRFRYYSVVGRKRGTILTANVLENDQVKIDFKPLHQCIHIYDALDSLEELQTNYQVDRTAQARLILSSTTTFSLNSLSNLLEQIVGFFIIEAKVLKITKSFRSEIVVDDLWEEMCERTIEIVNNGLRKCDDPEIFLGTKHKLLSFVQTVEVRFSSF